MAGKAPYNKNRSFLSLQSGRSRVSRRERRSRITRLYGKFTALLKSDCTLIRELKQQRRRRLQKRHLKSEFAPLQTLSRLFHLVYFVKCWQMFLELNSKGLYQSSGKEKKVVVLCSRPRQNVNLGIFTL